MFAVMRFRYIEVLFHIFYFYSIEVKKIVCYIEDFVISMFVKSRSALYRQIPRKYLYLQEL